MSAITSEKIDEISGLVDDAVLHLARTLSEVHEFGKNAHWWVREGLELKPTDPERPQKEVAQHELSVHMEQVRDHLSDLAAHLVCCRDLLRDAWIALEREEHAAKHRRAEAQP